MQWRRHRSRINWQQLRVLRSPFRRQSVQRTSCVVFLIGDHPPNANDQLIEALGCRPEIADAYHRIVEVGVENRRQHAALRRSPRIPEGQIHLEHMRVALQNLTRSRDIESAQVVREPIDFRRNSRLARDLNQRPAL